MQTHSSPESSSKEDTGVDVSEQRGRGPPPGLPPPMPCGPQNMETAVLVTFPLAQWFSNAGGHAVTGVLVWE